MSTLDLRAAEHDASELPDDGAEVDFAALDRAFSDNRIAEEKRRTPINTAPTSLLSSPPLADVVSSPPLADVVSSPPLADVVSSPPLADVVSSPPLADVVSSPPLADALSSPPLADVLSSPPLADVLSSPPLEDVLSNPPLAEFVLPDARSFQAVKLSYEQADEPSYDLVERESALAAGASSGLLTKRVSVAVLVAVIATQALVIAFRASRRTGDGSAYTASTGTLRIATTPSNATVLVDGGERGVTPLELALAPGAHAVTVALGSLRRDIPVQIAAGSTVSHHVEWSNAPTTANAGSVDIRSAPAGATVIVAGTARGKTPMVVQNLRPGVHDVLLTSGTQNIREKVTVAAGTLAHLAVRFADTPAATSGWIAISAPIELTILDDGQVIGTTRSRRIMVPAGRRSLQLVNEQLPYYASRSVHVAAGQTRSLRIEPPAATANIDAVPWAEVWLGERSLGRTPLAGVSLPIGVHQLVFKHPTLGERRQPITVVAGTVNRIGIDMNKK